MSLLINLLPYRPVATGLSRYSERLLQGWTQACGAEVPRQLRIDAAGKAVLRRDTSLPQLQTSRRMRWLQANALVQHGVPVKELVRQADPSVIYSPFTDFLFSVRDRPQVITCHDLIPLHYPSSQRAYWRSRLWLPRHFQAATKIVAISQAVADLLVADGLSPQRIVVIPNGIECVDDPIDQPISQDVMLLARHGVNKNVALALKGFARLLALEAGWTGRLRIVGGHSQTTKRLLALADDLGVAGHVDWIQHLEPNQLELFLRGSFCLISTSLMEGFDYPLFEAQARGVPTLASRIPVHEEFHRDTALLFELDDEGVSLAEAMRQLARDPLLWRQLSQTGLIHAGTFSIQRQISSLNSLLLEVSERAQSSSSSRM